MQPNIVNPRLIYALINWVHLHQQQHTAMPSQQLVICPGANHLFCLMTRPIVPRYNLSSNDPTIHRRLSEVDAAGTAWSLKSKHLGWDNCKLNYCWKYVYWKLLYFVLQHIQIDDLIDRTRPRVLIKGAPLTFPAESTPNFCSFSSFPLALTLMAALAEIKLNKFYNTFCSGTLATCGTHTCSTECNQFLTNDDDATGKQRAKERGRERERMREHTEITLVLNPTHL